MEKLPIISVSYKNKTYHALVDTGSSINIVAGDIVQESNDMQIECNFNLKTLLGGESKILRKVEMKFSIGENNFSDLFSVTATKLSNSFQIILGVPWLSKFNINVDFKDKLVKGSNFECPILTTPSNFVNHVQECSSVPVFSFKKTFIPPFSERFVQVKSKNVNNFSSNFVLISPYKVLNDAGVVGYTVCNNKEDQLWVKMINTSENKLHINKGTQLGFVEPALSEEASELVCQIQEQELGNIDNTDLSWSTDIDLSHLKGNLRERVKKFLDDNQDVFAGSILDLPGCDTVMHEIRLSDNKPVRSQPYRVPYNLREEMDRQINLLMEAKILVPSTAQYASPVILVKKADSSYRLACDFRRINKHIINDTFPIPNMAEAIDSLAGAKFFTTLDLTAGFHQQLIPPEQQDITTIVTHNKCLKWVRSPFGLSSSPRAFQRLMNVVLGDLENLNIIVYIDDICVSSVDIESHFSKLNLVFNRLRQHNLRLKPSKCHFFKSQITFLGFEVSDGQVRPAKKNIAVLEKIKCPTSRKQVRSFLGVVGFYRKHISDYSKRTIALTNLTKEKSKFVWSQEAEREFVDLKQALAQVPALFLPNMSQNFELFTDSSGFALGAVLCQKDSSGFPHPVAFASKKLSDVQCRYSVTERELLAVVWAVQYFKCYLYNRKFTLFTDHAALTYALKLRDPTSRIARWLCALSEFQFETKFIKGKCNGVADFLSRYIDHSLEFENNEEAFYCNYVHTLNVSEVDSSKLLNEIQIAQASDKFCKYVSSRLCKDLSVRPKHLDFFVEDEVLKCKNNNAKCRRDKGVKIVLPKSMILKIFELTHESDLACHAGFFKTFNRIKSNFFWPGMYVNVKRLIASCKSCLEFRAHKPKVLAELQRLPIPERPFQVIHSDICGPYTTTERGNRYLIKFVDSFSKWTEAIPVSNTTADTIAEVLADFVCRHGIPYTFITDKGRNYLSEALEKVYKNLGFNHIHTSSYHASSNAQAERNHAVVNNSLAHLVNSNHSDWDVKLKFALLALNSSVHSTINESPYFVVTGRDIKLPYNIFQQSKAINYNDCPSYCETLIKTLTHTFNETKIFLEKAAQKQEDTRKKVAVDKNIKVGDLVMLFTPVVKPGLTKKFTKFNSGPFRVIKQYNKVNFQIQCLENFKNIQIVHVDRLTKILNKPVFPTCPELLPSMDKGERDNCNVNVNSNTVNQNVEFNEENKSEDIWVNFRNRRQNRSNKLMFIHMPSSVNNECSTSGEVEVVSNFNDENSVIVNLNDNNNVSVSVDNQGESILSVVDPMQNLNGSQTCSPSSTLITKSTTKRNSKIPSIIKNIKDMPGSAKSTRGVRKKGVARSSLPVLSMSLRKRK